MFPVEMQHLNYVNYIFMPNMLHCKLRDIMLLLSGDMFLFNLDVLFIFWKLVHLKSDYI